MLRDRYGNIRMSHFTTSKKRASTDSLHQSFQAEEPAFDIIESTSLNGPRQNRCNRRQEVWHCGILPRKTARHILLDVQEIRSRESSCSTLTGDKPTIDKLDKTNEPSITTDDVAAAFEPQSQKQQDRNQNAFVSNPYHFSDDRRFSPVRKTPSKSRSPVKHINFDNFRCRTGDDESIDFD